MKRRLPHSLWVALLALLGACKPADPPQQAEAPSARRIEKSGRGPEAVAEGPQGNGPASIAEPLPPVPATPGTPSGAVVGGAQNALAADYVQYELRLDRAGLRRLDDSPFSNETCPAVFLAGGETFEGARVRYRGQWARSWPKKPLKVLLPKGKSYHGYGALNLNSPWRDRAMIREVLAYHVYAACGAPAPRARMVRLLINGQFEGVYVDVEQPKRQFLERIGTPGAAIYKALGRSNTSDERDFRSPARYAAQYEKETRESEGFADLHEFCHGLAVTPDAAAFLEQNVDMDRMVNFLAAGVLVQNWDCYNKNHHLVHDVGGSGKWFPTPWDVDRTFGDHWNGSFDVYDLPILMGTRNIPGVTGWNRLSESVLGVPEFRSRFLDRLEALIREEFTPARLYPVIDRWAAQIAADASADRARWRGGGGSLNAGIVQLKAYIEKRRVFLGREIAALRKSETRRPTRSTP